MNLDKDPRKVRNIQINGLSASTNLDHSEIDLSREKSDDYLRATKVAFWKNNGGIETNQVQLNMVPFPKPSPRIIEQEVEYSRPASLFLDTKGITPRKHAPDEFSGDLDDLASDFDCELSDLDLPPDFMPDLHGGDPADTDRSVDGEGNSGFAANGKTVHTPPGMLPPDSHWGAGWVDGEAGPQALLRLAQDVAGDIAGEPDWLGEYELSQEDIDAIYAGGGGDGEFVDLRGGRSHSDRALLEDVRDSAQAALEDMKKGGDVDSSVGAGDGAENADGSRKARETGPSQTEQSGGTGADAGPCSVPGVGPQSARDGHDVPCQPAQGAPKAPGRDGSAAATAAQPLGDAAAAVFARLTQLAAAVDAPAGGEGSAGSAGRAEAVSVSEVVGAGSQPATSAIPTQQEHTQGKSSAEQGGADGAQLKNAEQQSDSITATPGLSWATSVASGSGGWPGPPVPGGEAVGRAGPSPMPRPWQAGGPTAPGIGPSRRSPSPAAALAAASSVAVLTTDSSHDGGGGAAAARASSPGDPAKTHTGGPAADGAGDGGVRRSGPGDGVGASASTAGGQGGPMDGRRPRPPSASPRGAAPAAPWASPTAAERESLVWQRRPG